MSKLEELIAALERATGPSRDLDAEIDAALRIGNGYLPLWAFENFPTWRAKHRGTVEVVHDNGKGGLWWDSSPFTSSLDAAVALVERISPSTTMNIRIARDGSAHVQIFAHPEHRGLDPRGQHTITAIALCIAAIKAKLSQEEA